MERDGENNIVITLHFSKKIRSNKDLFSDIQTLEISLFFKEKKIVYRQIQLT